MLSRKNDLYANTTQTARGTHRPLAHALAVRVRAAPKHGAAFAVPHLEDPTTREG